MIEKTILDYLVSALTNIPVYMEVPKTPPSVYVVIDKTGSAEADRLRTATLAIQSIGPSLYEAACLSERVISAMKSATLKDVFGIKLNSDYNFTDTETKEYRYQAVFDITYR